MPSGIAISRLDLPATSIERTSRSLSVRLSGRKRWRIDPLQRWRDWRTVMLRKLAVKGTESIEFSVSVCRTTVTQSWRRRETVTLKQRRWIPAKTQFAKCDTSFYKSWTIHNNAAVSSGRGHLQVRQLHLLRIHPNYRIRL